MKIHINASKQYDVIVGSGILKQCASYIKEITSSRKAVIITDDNVERLYLQQVVDALQTAGIDTYSYTVPHGEKSKSFDNYKKILEYLLELKVSRTDMLIALGGGVVGDLTGFVASTYQRGMIFIQMPTTLLAAVDSSVGGKTAIDLGGGKNQVGTFYQPSLVICDIDTLVSLPDEEYRCGCAEVIKYGVLRDRTFFDEILATDIKSQYEKVIAACVQMKADIVEKDEYDKGTRALLNLGHTIGHAVESCSNFEILHGQAVAIGMSMIAKASHRHGYCDGQTVDSIDAILDKYSLPKSCKYSTTELAEEMLSDKKKSGDRIRLIVIDEIGRCHVESVPVQDIGQWVVDGM